MKEEICEHLRKYLDDHPRKVVDLRKEPYAPHHHMIICETCNTFVIRPDIVKGKRSDQ